MVKRKFGKTSKTFKILCPWLSAKLSLVFIPLLTAQIVKNSHFLPGIYFIFVKNVLDQT